MDAPTTPDERRQRIRLIDKLDAVNTDLLAIATPLSGGEAIAREEEILRRARECGIPVGESPAEDRSAWLSAIEQETRFHDSGISLVERNIIVVYAIPTNDESITAELVLKYSPQGELRRAYTRSIDRKGNRLSYEIEGEDALRLEAFFGHRDEYEGDKNREKPGEGASRPAMR